MPRLHRFVSPPIIYSLPGKVRLRAIYKAALCRTSNTAFPFFPFSAGSLLACIPPRLVVTRSPPPRPHLPLALHNRTTPDTAGVRHAPRATQVGLALHLTRSPAAARHPTDSSPRTPFSKWRALRRRGDPGIDIPDSLPRNTRVGSLLRKIGTVTYVRPEPERGLPFGVGPSDHCTKTGARWAGPT